MKAVVMDDLITWLRAQLDEDQRLIGSDSLCDTGWHWSDERFLAEVEAKRALIEETIRPFLGNDQTTGRVAWLALRLLALPYADREGFREEWRT